MRVNEIEASHSKLVDVYVSVAFVALRTLTVATAEHSFGARSAVTKELVATLTQFALFDYQLVAEQSVNLQSLHEVLTRAE